ncbi:hypothetical protein Btru_058282 [Bulinus truncatus]|nr:hypothetical protein Btru_058282 [Bulinus truncatus]
MAALLVVHIAAVSANSFQKREDCHDPYFLCKNTICLNPKLICDTEDNCGDGSDEVDCDTRWCGRDRFKCKSGQCIPNRKICDGDDDCRDKSDEDIVKCTTGSSATTVNASTTDGSVTAMMTVEIILTKTKSNAHRTP